MNTYTQENIIKMELPKKSWKFENWQDEMSGSLTADFTLYTGKLYTV